MIFDHFIVNKKFYILTMHKMCENVWINNFKKFLFYFLLNFGEKKITSAKSEW